MNKKLHVDYRTVFETDHGMLGRQVAQFEKSEDATEYAEMSGRLAILEREAKYAGTHYQNENMHLHEQLAAALGERDDAQRKLKGSFDMAKHLAAQVEGGAYSGDYGNGIRFAAEAILIYKPLF